MVNEFFHIVQWNVLLTEGQAHTGHPADYWTNTFIEAQAEFAASAQYPELELERSHLAADNSAYSSSANRFLAYRLNASYRELEADPTNKYDLALYWRFLYEHYGDMRIIRAALEEMVHQSYYSHDSTRHSNEQRRYLRNVTARLLTDVPSAPTHINVGITTDLSLSSVH